MLRAGLTWKSAKNVLDEHRLRNEVYMYVYTCIHVFTHIYIYICPRIRVYACLDALMQIQIFVCINRYVLYTNLSIMYVYIYIYVCICISAIYSLPPPSKYTG